MAYAVTQRTKEIGIRMTMGAQRRDVMQLILGQAIRPVATGVAIGMAASAGISRIADEPALRREPTGPRDLHRRGAILVGRGLLAGYVPAQRASRVDPMTALRHS